MKKWYESSNGKNHILISSRVRLARNLCSYPFSLKMSEAEASRMIGDIRERFF